MPRKNPQSGPRAKILGKPGTIPVEFYCPEDLEIRFVDGAFITRSHGMFILSFTQTQHPLTVSVEQAAKIKVVQSRCVARVAVSPDQMARTIQLFVENFQKFSQELQEHVAPTSKKRRSK